LNPRHTVLETVALPAELHPFALHYRMDNDISILGSPELSTPEKNSGRGDDLVCPRGPFMPDYLLTPLWRLECLAHYVRSGASGAVLNVGFPPRCLGFRSFVLIFANPMPPPSVIAIRRTTSGIPPDPPPVNATGACALGVAVGLTCLRVISVVFGASFNTDLPSVLVVRTAVVWPLLVHAGLDRGASGEANADAVNATASNISIASAKKSLRTFVFDLSTPINSSFRRRNHAP
jgi:hypothetical protein